MREGFRVFGFVSDIVAKDIWEVCKRACCSALLESLCCSEQGFPVNFVVDWVGVIIGVMSGGIGSGGGDIV